MVHVRSIGRRAADLLAQEPLTGSVLACFEHVCDLVTRDGQVLALVWHEVPDGPFHLLLDGPPDTRLLAGTRFSVDRTQLSFGRDISPINLCGARLYDPQPNWAALAARYHVIHARARLVEDLLVADAPRESMASLLLEVPFSGGFAARKRHQGIVPPPPGAGDAGGGGASAKNERTLGVRFLCVARRAIDDILHGQATGRAGLLDRGVEALCGLGPGLTPSGDDWLAGWLIGTRIANPAETAGREPVRRHAQTRTHALSRAFLECAADGDLDAHWQRLLATLAWGPERAVVPAARSVLARGATSGADMLTGFLAGLGVPVQISRGSRWSS